MLCLWVVFQDPIKPHEKRALNFLVHEYLIQLENKLTAITFSEENGDQVSPIGCVALRSCLCLIAVSPSEPESLGTRLV